MPTVPREKYPEMNWRTAEKVAAWRAFKWRMNVIFMADQVPEGRGSGPSYLWQEVTKHTTAGTLLKRELRIIRRWNRYGMHSRRALSNQPHFGISETHTWQTSDKMNRRQWLTWISTSSRLSGGANGRRNLRRSV